MNNIPVIKVEGKNIPEAWEKAVLETWKNGIEIKTEYDRKDDPPSRDCTMIIEIEDPYAEPRIHRAFPGGLNDLEEYRQEVVDGIHDYFLGTKDAWHYTYHERLFTYNIHGKKINQIDYIVQKLSEVKYSRRAQAITWNVDIDPPVDDAPCLQRVWCRILGDDELTLNMNTHWRSRDGYKAAFMNIFALTDLQKIIAEKISEKIGREVKVGRYVDIADSFHIYGSYYDEFKGFLKTVETRSFAERTWNSEFAKPIFEEEKIRLEKELKEDGRI